MYIIIYNNLLHATLLTEKSSTILVHWILISIVYLLYEGHTFFVGEDPNRVSDFKLFKILFVFSPEFPESF